jgi:hypothetical protein
VNRQLLTSLSIAAAAGLAAAIPIVFSVATGSGWLQDLPRFIGILPPLICPSWMLFWGTIGRPNDVSLLLRICGAVLVLNAVLYSPLGVLHAFTLRLRPAIRRTLLGVMHLCLLTVGYFFFLSEPAMFNPLYRGVTP